MINRSCQKVDDEPTLDYERYDSLDHNKQVLILKTHFENLKYINITMAVLHNDTYYEHWYDRIYEGLFHHDMMKDMECHKKLIIFPQIVHSKMESDKYSEQKFKLQRGCRPCNFKCNCCQHMHSRCCAGINMYYQENDYRPTKILCECCYRNCSFGKQCQALNDES